MNICRPGTYEHDESRNRKVTWHESFGGAPINLPSVAQTSTIPKNTEKVGLMSSVFSFYAFTAHVHELIFIVYLNS